VTPDDGPTRPKHVVERERLHCGRKCDVRMKSFTDFSKEHTASIFRVQILARLVSLFLVFAWLLLSFLFYTETGSRKFLRNVDEHLAGYTTQKTAATHSSLWPLWELHIQQEWSLESCCFIRLVVHLFAYCLFVCPSTVRMSGRRSPETCVSHRQHGMTSQGKACSGWVHSVFCFSYNYSLTKRSRRLYGVAL
jgi:hypothetical protein